MKTPVPPLSHPLLSLLTDLGHAAREIVSKALREMPVAERIRTTGHSGADVIYAIDREVEEMLLHIMADRAEALGGIVLVAEGIGKDEITCHPEGRADADCAWRMLVDPIDGTRGIMVDKRSAWFLAGAAPNRGPQTRLRDIDCAVMAEQPTSRAGFADIFAAVRGQGWSAETVSLLDDAPPKPYRPEPYPGPSIRGGFAQIARFFPPGREHLAALEEELMAGLFPDAVEGEILSFEDQYISTGGQLAQLITGKDRFTADLRATLYASPLYADKRIGHVCHPYDLAAVLIAEEAGILVTAPDGSPLDAPFDTRTAADWIAYANPTIRDEVQPLLTALMQKRGWLP